MKKGVLIFMAVLLCGCITQKKREEITGAFLISNPLYAAKYCATTFAPKDSVGGTVTTTAITQAANNKDYTGKVDSLNQRINILQGRMQADSAKVAAGGQISPAELLFYKNTITGLQKQISDLKASYVPCKPEIQTKTETKTVYVTNTAQVAALTETNGNLTTNNNTLSAKLDDANSLKKKYLWACIALAASWVIFLAIKILK